MAAPRNAMPVRNPRTGEIDLHITPASAEEVAAKAAALRAAQVEWGKAPVEHRIAVMQRWAEDGAQHHVRRDL